MMVRRDLERALPVCLHSTEHCARSGDEMDSGVRHMRHCRHYPDDQALSQENLPDTETRLPADDEES